MADSAGDLVIETYKLTKIYQNRQIALNDVTLKLEPGCVLGLLGHNGAGKTTLLRLVLGLHRPTAGWVKVFTRTMGPNAAALRCRIGYIPTNPQFPRGMTPISYLDYIARLFGLTAQIRKTRLATLIRAVDLLHVSGDRIDGFSNGMIARLAVATSLINEPDLLIWDEPTLGLDPEARRSMLELIKTLAREDVDRRQPQPQRYRRGVQSRGRAEPRPPDLLRLAAGSQGRMRRNHYELDLEGDQKSITKAMQAIKSLAELKTVNLRQRRLELRMTEEANNTAALANVFMTLADNKVTLVSVRTVGQQTEQAFLDLVEKEEARGFARAYQNPDAA